MNRAIATIDLQALCHNAALARSTAPDSKLIGVIKADAYGHGACRCADALNTLCDGYAVAFLEEAIELQNHGITKEIFLLEGFMTAEELTEIATRGLTPMIHHAFQLDLLERHTGDPLAHIMVKMDTGMHRLGFTGDQIDAALAFLSSHQSIEKITLATHFASADDPQDPMTRDQMVKVMAVAEKHGLDLSMANSPGLLKTQASHAAWNRAGIMLYGSTPFGADLNVHSLQLKPVMTLTAPVIALRTIPVGDGVGYGQNWHADRPTRIATLGIGYADGYPRVVKAGTEVCIQGHRAPIVGNVSMDMITIDVTDVDGVDIGTPAELWGDTILIDDVAAAAGTIGYELMTKVTSRVPRHYVGA